MLIVVEVGNNSYFSSDGTITECGKSLAAWQALGNDKGSTVAMTPSDAAILAQAKLKLGMQ